MNIRFRMKGITTVVLAGLFIFSAFRPLIATPVTICMRLTATVTEVQDQDNLLLGGIQRGDSISGTLTIPLGTPNSSTTAGSGVYIFNSAASFIITSTNFTFESDPSNVQCRMEVLKGASNITAVPFDSFMVRSDVNLPLNPSLTVDQICWQLTDPTSTALAGTQMRSSPLNLSNWQSIYGLMISGTSLLDTGNTYFIRAKVVSLTILP